MRIHWGCYFGYIWDHFSYTQKMYLLEFLLIKIYWCQIQCCFSKIIYFTFILERYSLLVYKCTVWHTKSYFLSVCYRYFLLTFIVGDEKSSVLFPLLQVDNLSILCSFLCRSSFSFILCTFIMIYLGGDIFIF